MQKITLAIHGGGILNNKERKIVTFYSPQGGTGKTTLAYICALLYSRNKSGVYLNLEEFGYTEHLYQNEFEIGMEDIMFAIKDKRDVVISITNAMKKDKRNVSILPKMNNYSDLADLNADDLVILMESIQQTSSENCVFVDLSGGLSEENRKIMELSDINFLVFEEGVVGKGKMERIKADRSVQDAPFFGRSYFLINKCKDRSEDIDAIHIPFSQSLFNGVDVETVLAGNRDFYQKCMEIMGMIDK